MTNIILSSKQFGLHFLFFFSRMCYYFIGGYLMYDGESYSTVSKQRRLFCSLLLKISACFQIHLVSVTTSNINKLCNFMTKRVFNLLNYLLSYILLSSLCFLNIKYTHTIYIPVPDTLQCYL